MKETGTETSAGAAKARRTGGRPRRLELETIVATARRILEEEGAAALSMRRLAKEVGSTPMALYRHVRDKDELLQLVLSGMARTRPRPELPEDPRERVYAVALHMHRTLQELPWVVEVLSLGELTDRDALWMVEEIIDSAMACGQSERRAVHTYRSIWHYVLGTLVFRAALARRAEDPGRRSAFPALLADADPSELPRLAALAGSWSGITDAYDVAEELRAVVTGLLGGGPGPGSD
ncbi:TetR/AcrR family transcriptional regulator [Streptomyces sp. NA02950]|uniref:TetR/AcrR family transcriptional regulator n=1 Tax=Streptomyces sp. NA02950 TaxID=2742137 RepID=UPI001591AFA9|nr:TetR/AcrR family transcriptional regulator [Streptomyces sp. NA02950]QKV93212.1 TetR/AcrR family transcriptional regulator [Streptomyces sp. NA02950]